jgi:hypothetical protein
MQRGKWMAMMLVATCGAALALAQSEQQQRTNPDRSSQRQGEQQWSEKGHQGEKGGECSPRANAGAAAPAQIADRVSQMRYSLVDAIQTAEEETHGKAVSAYCRFEPRSMGTGMSEHAGKKSEECGSGTQPDQVEACLVTVCTPDRKLVEVTVDDRDDRVISQREIPRLQSFAFFGPGVSSGAYAEAEPPHGMQEMSHPTSARPRRWAKCSDLLQAEVKNKNGQALGRVENLAIDPDNGRVLYGIVSYEGQYVAAPWSALSLSAGAKHFVLEISPGRLKAVAFARNDWPDLTDRAFMRQTYPYFGQRPGWATAPGELNR